MNDMVDDVIQYIANYIETNTDGRRKIRNKTQVREAIKTILTNEALIYQKSDDGSKNLINEDLADSVKLTVEDTGGSFHEFDINLIVGELIGESFHKTLVQYRMLLVDCGLTFEKKARQSGSTFNLSFDKPDHLFGMPPNYVQWLTYHYYDSSRVYTTFDYPGINEIIRTIFARYDMNDFRFVSKYSDLVKIATILEEEISSGWTLKETLLLLLDFSSLEAFRSSLPLSKEKLLSLFESDAKLTINDEELAIINRYLELLTSKFTESNGAEKLTESVQSLDFELLVKAKDSLYLDDNFLRDIWSLIVFLKESNQDVSWFNQLDNAFFRGAYGEFNKILCEFYKKYANYFPCDRFQNADIMKIGRRIYSILDSELVKRVNSIDYFVKVTHIVSITELKDRYDNGNDNDNDSDKKFDEMFVDSLFFNLNDYTKSILYSDYKIYDLLYKGENDAIRYCGSQESIYAFDLLLNNDLITVCKNNNLSEKPNFIKMANKLRTIEKLLSIIRENIYRIGFRELSYDFDPDRLVRSMGFNYELYPIKVVFNSHKGSSSYYDIQFMDTQVQIEIREEENNWDVVSIKSVNAGKKNNPKEGTIKGGRC